MYHGLLVSEYKYIQVLCCMQTFIYINLYDNGIPQILLRQVADL